MIWVDLSDYLKLAFCDLKPNRTVNTGSSRDWNWLQIVEFPLIWRTLLLTVITLPSIATNQEKCPWGLFQFLSSPPPGFLMFFPSLHHRQISANWRKTSWRFSYQTLPSPAPSNILPQQLLYHYGMAAPPYCLTATSGEGIGLIKMYTLRFTTYTSLSYNR